MNFKTIKVPTLFRRTSELESQIDEFLDVVTESGLIFKHAINVYLEQGPCEDFEKFLLRAEAIEARGDNLRRNIEIKLYAQTLIPDLRGDVLSLLEHVDNIVNIYEGNLFRFSIQSPEISPDLNKGFYELTETVVTCVESLVLATRAFFRDINAVRDHTRKVLFLESEADRMSTKLQRKVFASDIEHTRKRHLQYFVENIDELANAAEDVADELAIYTIKRKV